MYKYSHRGGRGFRRNFNRGGFGGQKRIKSFDPSSVVNLPPRPSMSEDEFHPSHRFSDFAILDILKKNIASKGYKDPTPIQDQAIPPILSGRDLIGMANTGTGKTAAFLIPLIDKVAKNRLQKVLIVTPTRELAVQIRDEFNSFAGGLNIFSALCIGGANIKRQKESLKQNPNFVIGTPGRIEDLIQQRNLNLSGFGSVVLDEADHMVDAGFIQSIRKIVSLLRENRQSLFFSATVDGKTNEVLRSFVVNPVSVSVKGGDITGNIKQEVLKVNGSDGKLSELCKLLEKEEFEKVLVFGRTKHGVQRLSDNLIKFGFKADAIHGNKNQNQRVRTLNNFKKDAIQILIATDVASRGLDIPNVSHVINYDLPESYEVYIHRIGRTGRADKKGTAITFTV